MKLLNEEIIMSVDSVHTKCAKCKRKIPFEFAERVDEKNLFETKFLWLCLKCFKKYNKLKIQAKLQEIKFKAKEMCKKINEIEVKERTHNAKDITPCKN